jgi:hypothetical protein
VVGGDCCSHVEHPFHLGMGEAECSGCVGHCEQRFAVGSEASVGTDAERRSAAGGALSGDEPLVGVRVSTGEHRCEVRSFDRPSQSKAARGASEPTAGFFTLIGVVTLGTGRARRSA